MRKAGTIVRWDEAKGFGFIRSDSVSQDVFVHVRDCRWGAGQVVRQGLPVTFDEIHGASPYGSGTFAASDGSRQPSDLEKEIAVSHGKHFAGITAKLAAA